MLQQPVQFEEAEAHLARELAQATAADPQANLGMAALDIGGATLMLMARYPGFSLFNRTVLLGLTRPASDQVIRDICAAARERGLEQVVIGLSPGAQPDDLAARLTAHGGVRAGGMTTLTQQLKRPGPAGFAGPEVKAAEPEATSVLQIGPEHIDTTLSVMAGGFGMPHMPDLRALLSSTVGRLGWAHYLAIWNGVPAACASLYLSGQNRSHDRSGPVDQAWGWLGNGATLPGFRQRGLQAALIRRRLQDAAAAGAGQLYVQVGKAPTGQPGPSERNLNRQGFRAVYSSVWYTLPT